VGGDGTGPLYSKAESVNVPFEVRGQNILKIICKWTFASCASAHINVCVR